MAKILKAVSGYARMWPREMFDHLDPDGIRKSTTLAKSVEFLNEPGVYVLYRDDVPYYVGKADKLRRRLWAHAMKPEARYYNFWNFFSAFVVLNAAQRDEVEGILISAMPTANSAQPKLPKEKLPKEVIAMVRKIRKDRANPD
ncbi:MAG TPA: GIY-YIG nuclease family protein [Acidobacteriaceae bacterium]